MSKIRRSWIRFLEGFSKEGVPTFSILLEFYTNILFLQFFF
ncbi:hypothetical protein [Leptospira adleri]|nr:hypothetical protein [Leptospira adleri]